MQGAVGQRISSCCLKSKFSRLQAPAFGSRIMHVNQSKLTSIRYYTIALAPDRTELIRSSFGKEPRILSNRTAAEWHCPRCGYIVASNDDIAPDAFFRPWHVRGRRAIKEYVESLGYEAREWLLALFVDSDLQLLAVDTIARGGVSNCPINFSRILFRGHMLNAAGFILVHNHPSGDPRPSDTDIRTTGALRHVSKELDIPLLDHLIIAGEQMMSVGGF